MNSCLHCKGSGFVRAVFCPQCLGAQPARCPRCGHEIGAEALDARTRFYLSCVECGWQGKGPLTEGVVAAGGALVNVEQAALLLGVSKRRVYQFIRQGRLPSEHLAGRILVRRDVVLRGVARKPHTGNKRKK